MLYIENIFSFNSIHEKSNVLYYIFSDFKTFYQYRKFLKLFKKIENDSKTLKAQCKLLINRFLYGVTLSNK